MAQSAYRIELLSENTKVPGGAPKKREQNELASLAKQYTGEQNGRIAATDARQKVLFHTMQDKAFKLTAQRVMQESRSGQTPGTATSIFKLVSPRQLVTRITIPALFPLFIPDLLPLTALQIARLSLLGNLLLQEKAPSHAKRRASA